MKRNLSALGLVEFQEQAGELFGLERGAAEVPPGAEGTVTAVLFAGGRWQGFEQEDVFPVRELGGVDEDFTGFGVRYLRFRCQAGGSKARGTRGGLEAAHSRQPLETIMREISRSAQKRGLTEKILLARQSDGMRP